MSYADSDRALTLLKRKPETAWLNEISSVPLQQSLRDLQQAFSNFFAKRTGYPNFKKKGTAGSARYTRSAFKLSDGRRLLIRKIGVIRIRWDRNLPSAPSSVTIMRKPSGRYFVSFVVDVDIQPKEMTGRNIGIDFGISRLATLSTGERIANPKHGAKRAKRLAMLQRRLMKKQKGSKRRQKAKLAVAKCYEKISNSRKDALDKLTTKLITDFDVINIEDLNLNGMAKNHSLAKSVRDASIGVAVRMLKEKADKYGKLVIQVNRWLPSSKMCSECGHIVSKLPLEIREWSCPECGAIHDRDVNAAKNILAVGNTVAAHGFGVRDAMPSGMEPC